MSANGRFVAFSTQAENLGGPIDPSSTNNVYVYDRSEKRVSLVSRRSESAGGAGADGDSRAAAISGSGRLVAFETSADLGGPLLGTFYNVYVYDRERRRVSLVSRQSAGPGSDGADEPSFLPAISDSGRVVSFQTSADNLGGPRLAGNNVYAYDRQRHRVELVSRD
jgi:hypothetical protein